MLQGVYAAYVFVGPICAVQAFEGRPPAVLLHSYLMYFSKGSWQFIESGDCLRLAIIHYITAVIPGTLWILALRRRW